MGYGVGDYHWWEYAIMPLMSGIVGYVTNRVALYMTFEPLEFVGYPFFRMKDQPWGLFGWQGIIPTKAAKMAAQSCDLMQEKLINVKEVFSRLDPAKFAEVMEPGLITLMDQIINETAAEFMPTVWEYLPTRVRDECVLKALEESPVFLNNFMADVKEHIEDVFDLKTMVVTKLTANKVSTNRR
tara:strand:- start:134 stop:685 length:552 start_codon:yes stop_codon:yes gene_type:complete